MTERKLAFYARVGSHEYNLNTETSDEDFKEFVFPTFEDLYYGKMYSQQTVSSETDVDVHDIRKIGDLFAKANLNFLEVLYSKKVVKNKDFPMLSLLFTMRDDIVNMNLPQLYKACRGMHMNKMRLLEKGTDGTQHLVEKYGYDTKQAQHAFRSLNFLDRFRGNGHNFEDAIWYDGSSKRFMLDIKDGFFKLDEFKEFMSRYDDTIAEMEDYYISQPFNAQTKAKIDAVIFATVKQAVLEND